MDEAEKYKQRLEAIAEKRRLQEEQDKAKREMEDEKIRLHQLKRKSLRDQWLMEGPPLSPVSPDPHSPRSPLWGSPTKENENHVDELLSKSQQLDEEEKEQMEDGQVQEAAVRVAEAAAAEMVHVIVVQNGESSVAVLESSEDEVSVHSPLHHDGSVVVITNGGGDLSHGTNGLVDSAEVVVSMKSAPALSLDTSEAEPGRVPHVNLNEEEEGEEGEEGTLVIRAECVMITDEGEEAPEDVAPKEEEREAEESPLLDPEETTEEELTKTESSQPSAEDGDAASEPQDPTSAAGLEAAAVASVPVYSRMDPPSTVAPVVEVEAAAAAAPAEGAQDPAPESGRFQEVPLADPLENQRTEAGQGEQKQQKQQQGEQEPLLSQAAAPITRAEPAAVAAAVNTETYSPNRASKGEEPTAPKRKTCQCCSVM